MYTKNIYMSTYMIFTVTEEDEALMNVLVQSSFLPLDFFTRHLQNMGLVSRDFKAVL